MADSPATTILCILDGWGIAPDSEHNAISRANTPNWDKLVRDYPSSALNTSGKDVGLPKGQMGNSEVGHMNIGAGRIVLQDLPRIDQAVTDGSLAQNQLLTDFIHTLKKAGGTCHIGGLMSPGGVHAHQDHIVALARIVSAAGVPVVIHAFLDGRDTPPSSARGYVADCMDALSALEQVRFGTISGRYYAMDRDQRWERTTLAYQALVQAEGPVATDPLTAIDTHYAQDVFDEFITPQVMEGYSGMHDGDGWLFANFRSDRARQLSLALLDPDFDGFERSRIVTFSTAVSMTEYSSALNRFYSVLFPPENITRTLGEVVADKGWQQLRLAETEKYAHVTFFLNGGREAEFDGEDRILVPSPKVATYDLQPEMSAAEVTQHLVGAIQSARYALIVVNYANTDMVGHSGNTEAATKAVEAVDQALGQVMEAVNTSDATLFVTADHGNAECMRDESTHGAHTAHTTNPVPFVMAGPAVKGVSKKLKDGRLCDIAPTLLLWMGLPVPDAMSGQSLLEDG